MGEWFGCKGASKGKHGPGAKNYAYITKILKFMFV